MKSITEQAKTVSQSPVMNSQDTQRITDYLTDQQERTPERVVAIHYLNKNPMEIQTSSKEKFRGINPQKLGASFTDDLNSLNNPSEVYISEPFEISIVDFPVIAVITPIEDNPDHALIYMINLEERVRILSLSQQEGQFTAIVDQDGKYVAHPNVEKVLTEYHAEGVELQSILSGQTNFRTHVEEIEGFSKMETTG